MSANSLTRNARKISDEVWVSNQPVVRVDGLDIAELQALAQTAPRGRVRLCAHPDGGDSLHEMFIALRKDSYIRPHRHHGKSESFHVVSGRVDVVFFSDDGAVTDVVQLEAPGGELPFYYRLAAPLFHTLIIHSDVLVIHETTNGPFVAEDAEMARWAPDESDHDAAGKFMDELSCKTGEGIA